MYTYMCVYRVGGDGEQDHLHVSTSFHNVRGKCLMTGWITTVGLGSTILH